MTIELEVQRATRFEPLPDDAQFRRWATTALQGRTRAELTIRLVGERESRRLNHRYRGRDSATNVLSFPTDLPPEVDPPLLGDIVICASLVMAEAAAQGKRPEDHWAHLTIHGVLHLLGYDHQEADEARAMESLEVELLHSLGVADPYLQREG